MEDLSPRQEEILQYLSACVDQEGVMPSYREIGSSLGIRSTNAVSDHLKALVRKGYLERVGSAGRSRSIRLTRKATGSLDEGSVVGIPILGDIAASPLYRLAEEDFQGTLRMDAGLLSGGGTVFALVVTGDSMIEAGIHDGDYLFVRQQADARDGEIAVVTVGEEATVKRFYREPDGIRLEPENSAMDPIHVSHDSGEDVRVVGVAVGVFRAMA